MSIRRQSCDPCFRARRKCDITYPVCQRCQRLSKNCHYVYPPPLPGRDDSWDVSTFDVTPPAIKSGPRLKRLKEDQDEYAARFESTYGSAMQSKELQRQIPRIFGHTGQLPPISGSADCTWILAQVREYPLAFARQAETIFINKALYGNSFPRSLRVAFGICAACLSLNDRNRSVVFQALDAEITELLTPPVTSTLLQDLVRLQAAVLYQIIRLFYGGIEQRVVAERQEFLLRSYGLTRLRRVDAELQDAPRTWEAWILAESIRRTVIVAFKLYTIYANFRHGACSEIAAISILPVSSRPGFWCSREAYLQSWDQDVTMTYAEFTRRWIAAPRRNLEAFEKFLLVGCRGTEQFEAIVGRSQNILE